MYMNTRHGVFDKPRTYLFTIKIKNTFLVDFYGVFLTFEAYVFVRYFSNYDRSKLQNYFHTYYCFLKPTGRNVTIIRPRSF